MLREELLRRFPRLGALPPGCWIVGGAIRDLLLGIDPADVDVACNDPHSVALHVGPRPIRLGSGEHLSAYRVVDGEHTYDFAAVLDGDIDADLRRRDFTVNAMAERLTDGVFLDPHKGREDLGARLVRMVEPSNFDDDPLRCLKAVRMAVSLAFEIEPVTLNALRQRSGAITSVAPERVTYELSAILSAGAFRKAVSLLRAGALDLPLFGRELDVSQYRSDELTLAGAFALLVDNPRQYAKQWRWSRDLLRQVQTLQPLMNSRGDLRIALYDAGETIARQLPPLLRAIGRDDQIAMPDFGIRSMLSGEEIAAITGTEPGEQLGRIKRALLEAEIRGEVKTRQEAERFVAAH